MSSRLTSESRIYAEKAKDLNRQVCLIVLLMSEVLIAALTDMVF